MKGVVQGSVEANHGPAGKDKSNREESSTVSDNPMFLYAAEYESVDDAKADLEELKELHREHVVGTYDAAVLTKNEEGKVDSGTAMGMGQVKGKFIVTPDWDKLF